MTIEERNRLVEEYLPLARAKVARFVALGIPSYIEADDLIQYASSRLIENIEQHDGRASLETFLNHAIRNDIINCIKSERSHWGRFSGGAPRRKLADIGTAGRAMRKGVRSSGIDVRAAINQLPPKQKDAIVYCDILGFSQEEAGRILGISHQAVSCRLDDARANLKQILEPTLQK